MGYTGIRHYFDAAEPLSTLQLCMLIMFSFFTGAGGSAGVTAATNATAKSFPDLMVRVVCNLQGAVVLVTDENRVSGQPRPV